MTELSSLQVFKYLPAAKKLPEGNCKKCKFPTCMAFALKISKGMADVNLCPYIPEELKEKLSKSLKKPQEELLIGQEIKVPIGGETVLYRHDKTFVNKCAMGVVLDCSKKDFANKLKSILDFKINRINDIFKVDFVLLKGKFDNSVTEKLKKAEIAYIVEQDLNFLEEVKDEGIIKTVEILTKIRKKAILEKDENFSKPVFVYLKHTENLLELDAKASIYLCKYANALLFEDFNEALFSTLMTLRQNIYTDPQKPLQVESKIYEFNNPDENALIFMTTNFALTFFAVANELEAINRGSYLVVTPSEGMSVLTAWSAEKFTAQIAAKTVKSANLQEKVKNKKIIIPGLLSHMKNELQKELPEFEIKIGTIEAYKIGDYVKNLDY